jgi:hypothetical protein
MFRRVIKWGIVIAVLAAAAYPITREMKARASIEHTMINALDANDAAALRQWPESIESFIAVLHERCMSTHNRDGDACARYQLGK